ncbi:MAG TPA: hypothetical protein VMM76_24675 [Pirellulaceae bacterium]|nr:hypothetical protein [Pirellulaceae bacterium]
MKFEVPDPKHCGLWQSRAARAQPEVDELVLELDAAYADNLLDSGDQADPSQELTYVDLCPTSVFALLV